MIFKSIFIFSLISLFTFIAQAGPHRIGNGGNGVTDSKTDSVYLLDFYETGIENDSFFNSQVPNIFTAEIETTLTPDQYPTKLIAAKISEVYALDKITATSLLTALRMYSWSFVTYDLEKTTDIATSINILPEHLLQIANRRYGQVLINKNLWKKMSEENQAGLVLHELIYSLALKTDVSDAEINLISRSVVGKIFSRDFQKIDSFSFQNIACSILPCIKNQLAQIDLAIDKPDFQNLNKTLPLSINSAANEFATLANIEATGFSTVQSHILQSTENKTLNLENYFASLCKPGATFLSLYSGYQVITFSLDKVNFGYIRWETKNIFPTLVGTQMNFCQSADTYQNLLSQTRDFFKPYWESK